MPNADHLALLQQGIDAWDTWREENPAVQPDLREADLAGATLITINFAGADLSGADLSGAQLVGADLMGARLVEANLTGADLSEANLAGARLQEAILGKITFGNTNLTDAVGLETCAYWGPSILDLGTLARSGGTLPRAFLQGCGLHDETIEVAQRYRKDLSRDQIEDLGYEIINAIPYLHYHRCFIAYAGSDIDFARRLHADLQANGIRCWLAPEDRPIDEATRLRDKLLLVLSKAAIDSGHAAAEADRALSRARIDERTILVPVRRDDTVFDLDEGWALPLKEDRTLGDFSDPATYDEAFQRLLRDLRK